MTSTTSVRDPAVERGPLRPRRRVVLIVVAAAVVLVVLGTWLVAFSPAFAVRNVEVRGAHALSVEQVRAAADVPGGTPLVRVDTSAITARVERLPEVASAQVSTSFPSTVVITIEERVPVGFVRRAGRVWLVDGTGVQYRQTQRAPTGLPRFVVPNGPDGQGTAAAVAAVGTALPASLRRSVRSIQALDPGSVTLVLDNQCVVRWGSAERSELKARLLPALLLRHPAQVDLTDPDQPITR